MIRQSFIIELSLGDKATNSILSFRGCDRGKTAAIGRRCSNQWQLDIHWLTVQPIAPFLLGVVKVARQSLLGDDVPIIYKVHSLADEAINSILSVRGGDRGETAAIGRRCSNHWQLDIQVCSITNLLCTIFNILQKKPFIYFSHVAASIGTLPPLLVKLPPLLV